MAAVTYHYKTKGTCSTDINLQVEDGVITDIEFWSGCNGNLQGICRLVKGMPVKEPFGRYPLWYATHVVSRPVVSGTS